jgi:protein-S-isoprenylcysteine O-methyltransferase Ste14
VEGGGFIDVGAVVLAPKDLRPKPALRHRYAPGDLVSIGMMVVPILWIFSNLFSSAYIGLPPVVKKIGIIIAVFSLWFFYEVHKTLGRNWSPVLEIREGHTLIKEGPYKKNKAPYVYSDMDMVDFSR